MIIKLRGFTLIELLVVIAIIGVLATVVIGSVNSARVKAADAAIKGNISNVRTTAETIYDETGNYTSVCATTSKGYEGVLAAAKVHGSTITVASNTTGAAANTASGILAVCVSNGVSWAAVSPLKGANYSTAWCADSSGSNKSVPAVVGSVTIAAAAGTPPTVKCP